MDTLETRNESIAPSNFNEVINRAATRDDYIAGKPCRLRRATIPDNNYNNRPCFTICAIVMPF